MDFNNMRLRRIRDDDTIETVAGNGEHLGAVDGASALDSPLENPIDFSPGPDSDLFIVSLDDPRVLRIDADGRASGSRMLARMRATAWRA